MADDLVLYSHPMSRGRIARWMLEEVGQPYRVEMLDYGTTMKAPEFLAINPMGKVPALRHGDVVVTEGAAICAYLADTFPKAGLAPPASKRGAYYRWLFFGAGPLEAAVTNKALKVEVPPERRGMIGYGSMDDVLGAVEQTLSANEHIAGEAFTAADVVVGSQIGWGMMFGTIDKRPVFETYWKRLADRPAAVRARAIDDALLPADKRMGL